MKPKFYLRFYWECETFMRTNLLIAPERISEAGTPVHDEKSLDTLAKMHQFQLDLSPHPIWKVNVGSRHFQCRLFTCINRIMNFRRTIDNSKDLIKCKPQSFILCCCGILCWYISGIFLSGERASTRWKLSMNSITSSASALLSLFNESMI